MFKRLMALALALMLLAPAVLAETAGGERFFPSATEALLAYTKYIRELDFREALACTTYRSQARYYQLDKDIELYRVFPRFRPFLPASQEAFLPLIEAEFLQSISKQLSSFVFTLLFPRVDVAHFAAAYARLNDGKFEDIYGVEFTPQEMIEQLNPERLRGLELAALRRPVSEAATEHRNSKHRLERLEREGLLEEEDLLAIFLLGEQAYLTAFLVSAYPEGWQIRFHSSTVMGFNADGVPQPIDQPSVRAYLQDAGYETVYLKEGFTP